MRLIPINKLNADKRVGCPICQSITCERVIDKAFSDADLAQFLSQFYSNQIDLDLLENIRFKVAYCADCDFLYQTETLDGSGMALLYDQWVDNQRSLKKKQFGAAKLYRQYAGQVEMINRLINRPPGQVAILEFGMGWGYWSRMAQAYGYQVEGFELSQERIAHAKSMGLTVIDQLPTGDRYDFIFSNQVFEHLPDPLETMIRLGSCLKPDGYIYIRVPDGRGVYNQLKKLGWNSALDAIHPLEHINCFTRRSLIELASKVSLYPIAEPLRINLQRIRSSLVRAFNDRFLTTHILFQSKSL
ncbi:MAG: SAM-dependent methyltransferase [Gammaproteobacteria bacterium]|jgi:SAM-dependent methyltransferase